ncbi:DUF1178 family protein [Sphingomonas oligoaromativorans]|uniref:DUF1178 family protein n=1 Tax=Sphingomonas oligoaromativorans TaxID=575322 RepID=UPI00141EF4F7|nr:DUF1178 family protein [Sphingomonas oligoaromativorans]NIJ33638.1 hypothetical protein [Sphingomonas oligoaromativorans]
MIVFDLNCGVGHVFEAWFGSQDDYDGQRERGLVFCPVCGDGEVSKAPMAPRISTGEGRPQADPQAMMRALMAAQAKLLSGSEDVGGRFAEEARAIHLGDAEERLIHGRATPTEARMLVEEGVPVAPLPFPVRDRTRDN